MSVLVVGAGIIGSSISRCLAARGAKVTVLEAAPAPAAGATGKSWAWLNANAKEPAHYRDLNLRSMQLWQQEHPNVATFGGGCLILHDERNAQSSSYPSQHIPAGPELQGLVPALNPTLAETCQHAKLYPQEGFCDPVQATTAFLADAVRSAAHVLYGQQVERIATHNGRATVVTTISSSSQPTPPQQPQQHQELSADVVVLAAGVGTSQLCAQLGYTLPLLHKPAAIVLTSPLAPGLLKQMLVTDTVFILQRPDGRFLIGETQPSDDANTDTSPANAARILQLAATAVPALSAVSQADLSTHVGYRPYPADGYPCVGFVPGCSNAYVAVTHSGMTLAPLIGQLVAEEVMQALNIDTSTLCGSSSSIPGNTGSNDTSSSTGRARFTQQEVDQLLAPYRPGRDFEAAVAKAAAQSKTSWTEMLRPSKQCK